MSAASADDRAAAASARLQAVAEQLPVGQAGQRVVRRLVPVAVGGGLELLGLAAQALGGRRDEPEDDGVEDGEADREGDRQGRDVLVHRGGDRRVGQVQLDDAVRTLRAVVLQGHVDLEQLVVAPRCRAVVGARVVGRVREAGDDVPVEGGAQLTRPGGLADELGVLRVVDDRAVGVEDLQLDRVEGGQLVAEAAELLGGVVDGLLHGGQALGVEAVGEVVRGELRLQTQADGHQGRVLRLLPGAVLDGRAQHGREHDADGDRQQQAEHAEAGQQAGSAQPAEEGHAL